MQKRGRLVGQRLLRFVDLGAGQAFEPADFVERHEREQPQEPADVGVVDIAPELPVLVRREHGFVEPDCACGGLAHFRAGRHGDERRGQSIERLESHPPAEIDAGDDVAPLVGPAHLQRHPIALVELGEIVSLQAHVVELEEGKLLLALKPQLDRIHGQHAIDREMPPDVAQELDVVELGEPVGVVGHDRVGLAVAEADEMRERLADARLVGLDLGDCHELAAFVLARRVADHGRAAAHQRHRLPARLLQPVQHHDADQVADMQRRGGAIEADIGDERSRAGLFVEAGEIGALMDEPPLLHHAQEVGSRLEHVGQAWSLGAIEQTSRRAAPEKQLGAKSSTAVRRLLRRPSHDNRAKTAYCESISLNRVCRLMATQIEVLRAGLQMLPQVAAHSAADTPDLRSIFTPRSHEGALDPAREIVVADRGVGKSFWSSVLKDSAARSAIAPVYPRLRLSDLSVSLGVIAHVPLSVVTLGWGAGYLRG